MRRRNRGGLGIREEMAEKWRARTDGDDMVAEWAREMVAKWESDEEIAIHWWEIPMRYGVSGPNQRGATFYLITAEGDVFPVED